METFDPDKYLANKKILDIERESKQEDTKQTFNELETSLRGIGQYAGMGFGDELEAGYKKLARGQNYDQALEEARRLNVQAEEENPLLYHGAGVGSDIALGALTGGLSKGAGLTAKAAQLLSKPLVGSAITGSITGIGSSDADKLSMDTGLNMTLGAALGSGGEFALGKAGKAIGNLASKAKGAKDILATKGISNFTNISEEGIENYAKNAKDINELGKLGNSKDIIEGITSKAKNIIDDNPYKKKGQELVDKSYDVLEQDRNKIDLDPIKKNFQIEIDKLKNKEGKSKDTIEAINILNDKLSQIDEIIGSGSIASPGMSWGQPIKSSGIEARRIKTVLQELDKDIKKYGGGFNNQYENTTAGTGLKSLRNDLDEQLKKNLEYKALTEEAANNFQLSEKLVKTFIDKNTGKTSIDQVYKILNKGIDDKNIISGGKLDQDVSFIDDILKSGGVNPIDDYSEKSLPNVLKNVGMLKSFDTPKAQGSNMMNQYGLMGIGSLGGGLAGAVGGALAGSYMQKNSGKVAKKLIDITGLSQPQKTIQKASGTGYGKVLKDALDQGANKFAVTHFLLSQNDKAYQALMNKEDK